MWKPILLAALCLIATNASARRSEWQPITPDDLSMKGEPKAPHAPAIYLYRQVDRDDDDGFEYVYERIKILTDEGKSRGNIEIPSLWNSGSVFDIEARTIRSDGTIVKFDGTIFEKTIARAEGVTILAKAFTLPDVEVGSIVEYRYRRHLSRGLAYDSRWLLSADLFTRRASFSLQSASGVGLHWTWPQGLPPGTMPPVRDNGVVRLQTSDVPAFVSEEFSPPDDLLKVRVDFHYTEFDDFEKDANVYWKKYGELENSHLNDFINQHTDMVKALDQIVLPSDPAETKLRKIYARVQQMRNLTFERRRTEQEEERESLRVNRDVADVWSRGYGDSAQLRLLFLALTRAAGMPADLVEVPTRDVYFFQREFMNRWELNSSIVRVRVEGEEMFLDPGVPFTPFGLLPWWETAVNALAIDHNGGAWVTTPLPLPEQSRIERDATLDLAADGTVEGKLTVTFTGLHALSQRLAERNTDLAERKRHLEAVVKSYVATAADVELTNNPDWSSSNPSFVAQFKIRVPGWVVAAGSRRLMPSSLFPGHDSEAFRHATRVHPLYFHFPYLQADHVTIRLPKELAAGGIPKPQDKNLKVLAFKRTVGIKEGQVQMDRELVLNTLLVPAEKFGDFRSFYQDVKTADEESIVISTGGDATGR